MKNKYSKIARLIEKFTDGDCTAVFKKDGFYYYPGDEEIGFRINENINDESNIEWAKFLKETFNFTLTQENLFTMSILHELGHHHTVDFFSAEEWETQALEKNIQDLEGTERMQAYFNMPIEKTATEWAVMFYTLGIKNMRAWNQRFNCAIAHALKKSH